MCNAEVRMQNAEVRMQNAEVRMQNAERRRLRRLTVVVCILHFAFCISPTAQQPPGLPGATPHAASDPSTTTPAPLENVSFEQRLETVLPLDARFRDESGRDV